MNVSEERRKEILGRMSAMAEELIEHGDAVVVLLTFMDDDEKGRFSRLLSVGRGNHYAREGIAYDYVMQMAAGTLPSDGQVMNQEEGL